LIGGFSGAESSKKVTEEYEGVFKLDRNQWAKEGLIKCNGINMLNSKTYKSD